MGIPPNPLAITLLAVVASVLLLRTEAHVGCEIHRNPSSVKLEIRSPSPPKTPDIANAAVPKEVILPPIAVSQCTIAENELEEEALKGRKQFQHSRRASGAEPAIIEDIIAKFSKPGITNMAAGCSWWTPPDECLKEASELVLSGGDEIHKYGDGRGLLELRDAVKAKLKDENGIEGKEVMITAGANQAFVNVCQTLVEEGDRVVLFAPFYFSHMVALQLVGANVVIAETDLNGQPDILSLCDILDEATSEGKDVKMVVMCTVGNPSGVVMSPKNVELVQDVCKIAGSWLVSDETYEYFTYNGAKHTSPNATEGVINLYSFSKAYGMPGWRVGYMAYPPSLHDDLAKVQDTIITMPSMLSQRMALRAMKVGRQWVDDKVKQLSAVRDRMWDICMPLCPVEPNGAFYMFVPIPSTMSEGKVIEIFAKKCNILLTPGSAFGVENHVRVAFGALRPEEVDDALTRLTQGMSEMCSVGLKLSWDHLLGDATANGRDGEWGPPLAPLDELVKAENAKEQAKILAHRSHNDHGQAHMEDH